MGQKRDDGLKLKILSHQLHNGQKMYLLCVNLMPLKAFALKENPPQILALSQVLLYLVTVLGGHIKCLQKLLRDPNKLSSIDSQI